MNFGHGELGFGACPSAKSKPVAEYCTVLSESTPSAFDAPAMTAVASCAAGAAAASASPTISPSPARLFLTIDHRLSEGPAPPTCPAEARSAEAEARQCHDERRRAL